MSIAFTLDSPPQHSPTGRLLDVKLHDFQIHALAALDQMTGYSRMTQGQPLMRGPFLSPGRSMGAPTPLLTRPLRRLIEEYNWVYLAKSPIASKFNKRTRNKFLGIEKPAQEVNSNKHTKKKSKRKSK